MRILPRLLSGRLAGLLAFPLVVLGDAAPPDAENLRTSVVAKNGMPRNIVTPGAQWNFGPGSLWTHRGWQYAAYWDEQCQVSVARRKLPVGEWSTLSLPDYQRTKNLNRGKGGAKSQGFGDGHEKVSMGISPDGVIHLSFDHHLSTLRYRATRTGVANAPEKHPWTPTLFGPVQDHLGGEPITSVTYPSFTTDGAHFTLYLRLNGGSGSADSHYFQYADGRWQDASPTSGKLIDKHWSGGNRTVNAYLHGPVSQGGRLHLTWCWRDTPDSRTNHDLCYAFSDDHGSTWKNNEGQTIGVIGRKFITADSPGVTAVKIPPGTSYLNGGSMTVDATGRVHVLKKGPNRKPTYFTRDPKSGTWRHQDTTRLGKLVAGRNDELFIVAEEGLWKTSANHFGQLDPVFTDMERYFSDSKMGLDSSRLAHDGWISVIGQRGRTITVIDYKVSH